MEGGKNNAIACFAKGVGFVAFEVQQAGHFFHLFHLLLAFVKDSAVGLFI